MRIYYGHLKVEIHKGYSTYYDNTKSYIVLNEDKEKCIPEIMESQGIIPDNIGIVDINFNTLNDVFLFIYDEDYGQIQEHKIGLRRSLYGEIFKKAICPPVFLNISQGDFHFFVLKEFKKT